MVGWMVVFREKSDEYRVKIGYLGRVNRIWVGGIDGACALGWVSGF